jgi:hypothetical protein
VTPSPTCPGGWSARIGPHLHIGWFGGANLVAATVLSVLDRSAFVSLWCVWAALTSVAIAVQLRSSPRPPARSLAPAGCATVEVSRHNGRVVVEVVDDGIGGADTELGSGLRGLADRVEALDGRLRIWSPTCGGTRVRAEIPCAP